MRATDYFYYMDLLDKCGYYKEADDVYSLVKTAQRTNLDDTVLPGNIKTKGNKVPQNYNIYGRPTGWRSLPRNMNQGMGLDGTTVLPPTTSLITNPSVLDGPTILPENVRRRTNLQGLDGPTVLPQNVRSRTNPQGLDGPTILPENVRRRTNLQGLDGPTVLPENVRRRTSPQGLDGPTVLPQNVRSRTSPVSKTILDAFVDLNDNLQVKALDLQKAGKPIPNNLMNAFEYSPGLHSLPGDPDAHLFLKLQIIHNAFSALDPRKDDRGAPAYSLNPKLFRQLAKKYFLPELLVNSFLRDPNNEIKVDQNRSAFFAKAAEIEKLASSNSGAWNKFINNPAFSKMINSKVLAMFKNLGTNSKSLSQSLRQMPPQSPLWALLEPALEFGLYQFGLYLENPSAYTLETPEQKTIKDLNAKISEIIANPKITDKRGYFIKNYGSYLKTLGSMEQNELMSKFPVMGFGSFMNIGKNIGQK